MYVAKQTADTLGGFKAEELNLSETVQAPVVQGQSLGSVTYYLNGNKLDSVNLVAENSVNKIDLLNMTKHIFSKWFSLLRIA